LRKAVSLNANEAFGYYNLGVALVMLGDLPGVSPPDREGYFSEAELAFGQAAQLDPKNATYPAHVELARARRSALQPPTP
jgi:tetratricopeptide (TPR) repeat protein